MAEQFSAGKWMAGKGPSENDILAMVREKPRPRESFTPSQLVRVKALIRKGHLRDNNGMIEVAPPRSPFDLR
jgi:hypothetical protein